MGMSIEVEMEKTVVMAASPEEASLEEQAQMAASVGWEPRGQGDAGAGLDFPMAAVAEQMAAAWGGVAGVEVAEALAVEKGVREGWVVG